MVPKIGDKVKFSGGYVLYLRLNGNATSAWSNKILDVIDVELGIAGFLNIHVTPEGFANVVKATVVIDANGRLFGANNITPFEAVGRVCGVTKKKRKGPTEDDRCPICGVMGELDRMACICRNRDCERHVIWGA